MTDVAHAAMHKRVRHTEHHRHLALYLFISSVVDIVNDLVLSMKLSSPWRHALRLLLFAYLCHGAGPISDTDTESLASASSLGLIFTAESYEISIAAMFIDRARSSSAT